MAAILAGIAELLWFLFSGRLIKDIIELRRYNQAGGAQVVFFYKAGIDEQWLGATAVACGRRISTAIVVNPRSGLAHQTRSSRVFHVSQFSVYWLNCKVFISTATLASWNVPRKAEFVVHMPHSLVSLHAVYTPGAFDHYTLLFSGGPHHTRELEAMDKAAGRMPRLALPVGYSKLDLLLEEYGQAVPKKGDRLQLLLAPSWGPTNILQLMGPELVQGLLARGFELVLRPHPLQMDSQIVKTIQRDQASNPFFRLEDPGSSQNSLYTADLMISDYSGVALEFAFLRLRPVLFIDVPPKINNPSWAGLGLPLMELTLRSKLGRILPTNDLALILESAELLAGTADTWQEKIQAVRQESVYNYGNTYAAACEEIERLLAADKDRH